MNEPQSEWMLEVFTRHPTRFLPQSPRHHYDHPQLGWSSNSSIRHFVLAGEGSVDALLEGDELVELLGDVSLGDGHLGGRDFDHHLVVLATGLAAGGLGLVHGSASGSTRDEGGHGGSGSASLDDLTTADIHGHHGDVGGEHGVEMGIGRVQVLPAFIGAGRTPGGSGWGWGASDSEIHPYPITVFARQKPSPGWTYNAAKTKKPIVFVNCSGVRKFYSNWSQNATWSWVRWPRLAG